MDLGRVQFGLLLFILGCWCHVNTESMTLHNCSTTRGVGGTEIFCPSEEPIFILNVYKLKSPTYVKLVCIPSSNHTWNTILESVRDLNVGKIESFMIRMCPGVPDYTFSDLIEAMGITDLQDFHLVLTSQPAHLKRSHLKGLKGLKRLYLSSNRFHTLDEDLLEDLGNLTWLDLKNNRLSLPKRIFQGVPNLEVLELGGNNMSYLEPGTLKNLTRLRLLNLWGNRLQNLTRSVLKDAPALESLDLSSNRLQHLPPDIFTDLTKLKLLNLFNNDFVSLPKNLFSGNPNLEKVQFNNNGRSIHLPAMLLSGLGSLKEVKFSDCKLTDLPNDLLKDSQAVTNMTFRRNSIKSLPDNLFASSVNLLGLDLRFNLIDFTNQSTPFRNLVALRSLDLSDNQISVLHQNLFSALALLEYLNLSNNRITSVHSLAFAGISELRFLSLSYNSIADLSMEFLDSSEDLSLFYNCIKLEDLDLSYNKLDYIFHDWKNKASLRKLNLSNNNFTNITFVDLTLVGKNPVLDLSYNQITYVNLDKAEFYSLLMYQGTNVGTDQLKNEGTRVSLKGNPISCDCSTYQLVRYARGEMNPEVLYMVDLNLDEISCYDSPLSKVDLRLLVCPVDEVCPEECNCYYRPHDFAYLIDCSNLNLTRPPQNVTLYKMANHTELDLSSNMIVNFKVDNPVGYNKTTKIFLSGNHLTSINISYFNISKLESVLLDDNNLTSLDDKTVEIMSLATNLRKVTLHGNPWLCDCSSVTLLDFLQSSYTKVNYVQNITCADGRKMSQLTLTQVCPSIEVITVGVSVALAGLLIGMCLAVYFRYQREIKVWLYSRNLCLWLITEQELDKDKVYDAFISYSHKDHDFVAKKLAPALENGVPQFKLCLHYRDWIVGDLIPDQIARSIEESRRTIVILSPAFLESVWGKMEFRVAYRQALADRRNRLIVVIYGDVGPTNYLDPELKAYLSTNTYIKWDDPWFWDRIKYALPHKNKVPSSNLPQKLQSTDLVPQKPVGDEDDNSMKC